MELYKKKLQNFTSHENVSSLFFDRYVRAEMNVHALKELVVRV